MPSPLHKHFFAMACNNAWANARLLSACARLGEGEFTAERSGFFPSICDTFNHSLTVNWYYLDAIERTLEGRPANDAPAQCFEPEQPFGTVDALTKAERSADLRLMACVKNASEFDLSTMVRIKRSTRDFRETLERTLSHLFQHQLHHRGQVHAMMSSSTVAPPQLDEFFCSAEAPLRAAELADLGLTEASIWGTSD